jgi:hypothetical protein|tara:strand:- start:250 stop:591 length:342 start_codon:yes stop_codon:yes gene_type:complete
MKFNGKPTKIEEMSQSLRCPSCNEYGGLHQEIITVYPRGGGIIQIDSSNGNIRTRESETPERSLNPSMYRDGLTVHFSCEHCDGHEDDQTNLRIYQHKGMTLLDWKGDILDET